jgi:hypothetical protein
MKKKLNLKELEVKSFVTSMGKNQADTIKGGVTIEPYCNTDINKTICLPYPVITVPNLGACLVISDALTC